MFDWVRLLWKALLGFFIGRTESGEPKLDVIKTIELSLTREGVQSEATFRARFRFRLQNKLNVASREYRYSVGTHEIVISPQDPKALISESDWLVMNARGFSSENEAMVFANKLKAAAEISSIAARIGIDSGINVATAGLGQLVRDHLRETHDLLVRDNVHGVDVFPDFPNVRIVSINMSATTLKAPDPFLSDLAIFHDLAEGATQITKDVILLLNYALMRPEPVAQIVYAVSAVEMLGQQENWTADQKRLLTILASNAEAAEICNADERIEVAVAIRSGVHKLSLRQGVLRLLTALNLEHLKKEWDVMYGQRSTLVHGLAPRPGADYGELAHKALSLCGQILLKVVARDVALADKHVDKFYKT